MGLIRKGLIFLASVVCLLISCLVALLFLQPRIPLGGLTRPASILLSICTGSTQVVDGIFHVTPGKWVTLEASDAHILFADSKGSRLRAQFGLAAVRIHIPSLLAGELLLDGVVLSTVSADLSIAADREGAFGAGLFRDDSDPEWLHSYATGQIDINEVSLSVTRNGSPGQTILIRQVSGWLASQADSALVIEAAVNSKALSVEMTASPRRAADGACQPYTYSAAARYESIAVEVGGNTGSCGEQPQLDGEFTLTADDAYDVARLFTSAAHAGFPVKLQGSYSLGFAGCMMRLAEFTPIFRQMDMSVRADGMDPVAAKIRMSLRSEFLDLDRLQELIAVIRGGEQEDVRSADPLYALENLVIPARFPWRHLEIDADVARLVLAQETLEQMRFLAAMDDGKIEVGHFSIIRGQHHLTGVGSLDISAGKPVLTARLNLPHLDVGALFQQLGLGSESIEMQVSAAVAELTTQGQGLSDWYENLVVSMDTGKGLVRYRDPNTGSMVPIAVPRLHLSIAPGTGLRAAIDGMLGTTPFSLTMTFDDVRQARARRSDHLQFHAVATVADGQWRWDGRIPFPFRLEGLALTSRYHGEGFRHLSELLNLELPDIGPFALLGTIRVTPEGYHLDDLDFQLGESRLGGALFLDTRARPPVLDVRVDAPIIQLDDFRPLLLRGKDADAAVTDVRDHSHRSVVKPLVRSGERKRSQGGQQSIGWCDTAVRIQLEKVMSGTEHLGTGFVQLDRSAGRLRVERFHLGSAKGSLDGSLQIEPGISGIRNYSLSLNLEDVDYGVIGRYLKPSSDLQGRITLRLLLESTIPENGRIMDHASGFVHFVLEPELLRAGVIDLWAINLLSYLIPVMNPDNQSRVNCVAGRFNMTEGYLKEEGLLVDTSRIQVKGTFEVDFRKNTVDAFFRPIPKRPQFYSLATPIVVSGSLGDIQVGVATGGILGTLIRLATSYIVVPVQWIVLNKIPANAAEDCLKFMDDRLWNKRSEP